MWGIIRFFVIVFLAFLEPAPASASSKPTFEPLAVRFRQIIQIVETLRIVVLFIIGVLIRCLGGPPASPTADPRGFLAHKTAVSNVRTRFFGVPGEWPIIYGSEQQWQQQYYIDGKGDPEIFLLAIGVPASVPSSSFIPASTLAARIATQAMQRFDNQENFQSRLSSLMAQFDRSGSIKPSHIGLGDVDGPPRLRGTRHNACSPHLSRNPLFRSSLRNSSAALDPRPRAPQKHRSWSASFSQRIARILPANRKERGHTLRSNFPNDDEASDAIGGDTLVGPATSIQELRFNQSNGGSQLDTCDYNSHIRDRSVHGDNEDPTWASPYHEPPALDLRIAAIINSDDSDEVDVPKDTQKQNLLRRSGRSIQKSFSFKGLRNEKTREADCSQVSSQVDEQSHQHQEGLPISFVHQRISPRRLLKDSGDYLGVQGANPRSGTWDPSLTSSEQTELMEQERKRLEAEKEALERNQEDLDASKIRQQVEAIRLQQRLDRRVEDRAAKMERLRERQNKETWKQGYRDWHILTEPKLTPIRGSPSIDDSRRASFLSHPPPKIESPLAISHLVDVDGSYGQKRADSHKLYNDHRSTPILKDIKDPPNFTQRRQNNSSTETVLHHYPSTIKKIIINKDHPYQNPASNSQKHDKRSDLNSPTKEMATQTRPSFVPRLETFTRIQLPSNPGSLFENPPCLDATRKEEQLSGSPPDCLSSGLTQAEVENSSPPPAVGPKPRRRQVTKKEHHHHHYHTHNHQHIYHEYIHHHHYHYHGANSALRIFDGKGVRFKDPPALESIQREDTPAAQEHIKSTTHHNPLSAKVPIPEIARQMVRKRRHRASFK